MSDPAPILDELRAMAVFATVVRSGSFAAAARSLGLTRAVVSHHIRALEVKLGVPLAQRSTRSFSLTPAGEAFRVHCERLLDEANDGIRGMELLRAEPRGEVRITCSHHFGSKRILPGLLEFRRRYPAIRLHVSMNDANVDLVQQGIELAVRAGPLADSSLVARRLVREPTMLCASPAYLRRYRTPTSVAELEQHRWVVYPPSQRGMTVRVDGQEVQVPVRGDVVTDSAASRLAFVLAGEGIARLPAYDAASLLGSGELVRVLPDVETAALEIYLVHSQRIGPSARLLRDFLLAGQHDEEGNKSALFT
ncbi:LysR family transcriptional regulator [Pseudoduganella sp. FT25W]|uniref:LysR family transcriptional regulator n=1 Tax=Duganella alba TaxID=2666081 RepID=A0A6L5QQ98_9BURK|nr:LysR family transcriptional regulator [Duganella alba]MRX11482.1 LysR family transcriptional regulator [Duganella alba]MRX19631.1 LysR family transcriptional regulator [Duganella alba]